jgi:Family of unknown function (DUF5906)
MERQKARELEIQQMLVDVVTDKDIYYLADQNRYLMYRKGKGWKTYLAEAMHKVLGLTESVEKQCLDEVLRAARRLKETSAITFADCDDTVLNFLSRKDWLKPVEGDYNAVFDIVMQSLSDGKQENRDHIEKCLVYKYLHPEDYRIPCITISGGGGAGKNEFVEQVLATIFGGLQVAVLGTEAAFGQFNGQMIGKTVVFIDEAIVEKSDAEDLKRKVGNKTISINEKYGLQGTYDNTPWYWLGGNGTNGAVMLAKDVTDRRYSVLTVKHSVMYWVAKYLDIELPRVGAVLPDSHEAVQWYRENQWALSDRTQVSHWLHSLIERWGDQKFVPSALHADDYEAVAESQKNTLDETMEFVFKRDTFAHIEATTLYRVYRLLCKETSTGYVKKRNTFYTDARRWLEINMPHIVWRKINIKLGPKEKTSANVFTYLDVSMVARNDHDFIMLDDYGDDESVKEITEKVEWEAA